MKNLDKLSDTIDDFFKSQRADEYFKEIKKLRKNKNRYINKYTNLLKKCDNINIFMDKIFLWEHKYEEKKYMNGVSATSNFFQIIFNVWERNGKEEVIDEPFLTESYTWLEYTFKIYVGQGVYFRVVKNNKIIFYSY